MRYLLASAAAVAALVSVPASATTFLINGGAAITVPPTASFAQTDTFSATGAYTSLYEFVLGTTLVLSSASFTNSGDTADYGTNAAVIYYNGPAATSSFGMTGPSMGSGATAHTGLREDFGMDGTLIAGRYTLAVTGNAKTVGGILSSNFTFSAPAVPEPATWGLMVLGFGAIGGALRTSRRKVVFA